MGKIATESYAASKGGGSTSTGNKCCTKSRAEALGCTVNGSYSTNQLVQETDLSAGKVTLKVTMNGLGYSVRAEGTTLNMNGTITIPKSEVDLVLTNTGLGSTTGVSISSKNCRMVSSSSSITINSNGVSGTAKLQINQPKTLTLTSIGTSPEFIIG